MPATARKNMILGQLYTNSVHDPRILDAIAEVPRELFVPQALQGSAYVDEDLAVGGDRYLLAPMTLAKLLTLAELTPNCRVLSIGCLTGYSAAVLAKLCTQVTATDIDTTATAQARDHMKRLGLPNVFVYDVRNLADGYPGAAPYDVILVNGAVNIIPEALGTQLALGGRLVTVRNVAIRPDIQGGLGKGLLVKRIDNKLQYREYFDTGACLLPGFERESGFTF